MEALTAAEKKGIWCILTQVVSLGSGASSTAFVLGQWQSLDLVRKVSAQSPCSDITLQEEAACMLRVLATSAAQLTKPQVCTRMLLLLSLPSALILSSCGSCIAELMHSSCPCLQAV